MSPKVLTFHITITMGVVDQSFHHWLESYVEDRLWVLGAAILEFILIKSPSPWSIFFDLCMLYDFVQFVGSLQILSIKNGVHLLSGHDLLTGVLDILLHSYCIRHYTYCSHHLRSQNSLSPLLLELITFWEWIIFYFCYFIPTNHFSGFCWLWTVLSF